MATLDRKKLALLRIAAKDRNWNEDTYRAILLAHGGVESARDLTLDGFDAVMKHATACGFRSTWTKRTFGNRRDMASPGQVETIRSLWAQYHGPDEGDRALNSWLHKYHKVSALRFVKAGKVSAIMAGLRSMVARKKGVAA